MAFITKPQESIKHSTRFYKTNFQMTAKTPTKKYSSVGAALSINFYYCPAIACCKVVTSLTSRLPSKFVSA